MKKKSFLASNDFHFALSAFIFYLFKVSDVSNVYRGGISLLLKEKKSPLMY